MRSFRAAALLFALSALLSESQSAHSDRSRQRSGPIRSVPVAADIKRDADFDCPEEFGYYPHPTDCTLYYVCVFGGALLESCTGGLMYSHELQTCDWPRNVGCDALGPIDGDELERVIEKKPQPPAPAPPPRRALATLPPPPLRVQPNPVVTSRGQPKFTREEYVKQQQLYAEVDNLPPVEEIENDRQQRVYRGQPSTIGQVQRDRDGYAQISSGRTLNSNIIPASIPHNSGKIGSFSFGTQVAERRPIATQAPQSFSENKNDLTDSSHDRQSDIETNVIDTTQVEKKSIRRKREVIAELLNSNGNLTILKADNISKRNDEDIEDYVETETEFNPDGLEDSDDDIERGKRQITHGRYYFKDGYKPSGKTAWAANHKPAKYVNIPDINYSTPSNAQNLRFQPAFNSLSPNFFFDGTHKPYVDGNQFSTAMPFFSQQSDNKPFKPSLPDFSSQVKEVFSPINSATRIITKSPPISSLTNNQNPFAALAGGFFNNNIRPNNNQHNVNKQHSQLNINSNNQLPNQNIFFDSYQLPSTVVTGKPILLKKPRNPPKYRLNPDQTKSNIESQNDRDHLENMHKNHKPNPTSNTSNEEETNDESDEKETNSSEEESSEKEENEDDKNIEHSFPDPPYEFTHPSYTDIENPFADPNFDFDQFIAKLRDGHEKATETTTPKHQINHLNPKTLSAPLRSTTTTPPKTGFRSSTLNYHGMSTPRPFSIPSETNPWPHHNPNGPALTSTTSQPVTSKFEQIFKIPSFEENQRPLPNYRQQQQQQPSSLNHNIYNRPFQINADTPLDALRPKLKPPNFQDDRQLPINYNFNQALQSTTRSTTEKIQFKNRFNHNQIFSISQNPHVVITATGSPIYFSTPKQQYFSTAKPYVFSSVKPNSLYELNKSTPRPLTTVANEQLTALQQFWKNKNKEEEIKQVPTQPTPVSNIPSLESLFGLGGKPTAQSNLSGITNIAHMYSKETPNTTVKSPRRPIPKPSPEMSDYYYDDDDDNYYFEPPVKSQYMPSTEVRPQRPPMAQNYQEYDDSESYEDETPELNPQKPPFKKPPNYNTYKTDLATKHQNDVSFITNPSNKETKNNVKNVIAFNAVTSTPNVIIRPEIANYKVLHYPTRNKTMRIKRPEFHPYTMVPPKYLNQTTLRPYTVRHRLAKPTTAQTQINQGQDINSTKGRTRHPNIVTQTRATTPRDSHNQETRNSKTQHDDRTNSLEPTENVTPSPYQPSPRPKMLYNGSQSYNPEQYDPYYAVYDEDSELYKDTDYVQQYNLASLRPAVQQTYRGTPPPVRRPVETFTARPATPADYDDELIQGQINNQNQYQTPIRHSTRGEGNELGYDNNPSSVRTTIFEATSISTTPSTTSSTSTTTTQRPTVAPFTEAMIPSRFTTRSSTENPVEKSESSLSDQQHSNNTFHLSIPLTTLPFVNFSSLAKPFEKTDNLYRLKETFSSTETLPRLSSNHVSNDDGNGETVQLNPIDDDKNKKVVSLTSGFSIRRNLNNTNNPYTLTVLTRPFENYEQSREKDKTSPKFNKQENTERHFNNYDDNENRKKPAKDGYKNNENTSLDVSMRRADSSSEIISEDPDLPIHVRPSIRLRVVEPKVKTTIPTTTAATKFFLKTVIRRPVPFSLQDELHFSTENSIDTEDLIERALVNSQVDEYSSKNYTNSGELPQWDHNDESRDSWNEPRVGPYKTINNIKKQSEVKNEFEIDSTTTRSTPKLNLKTINLENQHDIDRSGAPPSTRPSYYAYRVVDEQIRPDYTTEVFNTKTKSILKAFLNNFLSTPKPRKHIHIVSSTPKPLPGQEKVVNIGFHKKILPFADNIPIRTNVPRLQIITEPIESRYITPTIETIKFSHPEIKSTFTPTTPVLATSSANIQSTSSMVESTTNSQYQEIPSRELYDSRFGSFLRDDHTENHNSQKFHKIVSEDSTTESITDVQKKGNYNNEDNELTKLTKTNYENAKDLINFEPERHSSTTTRTTKGTTTTFRHIETTTPTKSSSFPTRASRVNPAIKLAAANPGGGRRSYQSSSKCSSDNGLQDNPKCNEIKYQRPTLPPTRGRGSAHYSTSGVEASQPQQTPNRGTPPTRSRPTLKPSTSIVSKSTEFVDIYSYPPRRPSPVYPQPTPDKTAAKCRKDVCLLPDCSCGGKEIPGDMPVESVPQMVLLTFDDSVNDLNKVLYQDLFEKGRVNPNGCPISATFYVSHEWTDYSQVQNLYAAGHEMASHTISHSFGEQFSQKKWNREVGGQREILSAYGGVKLEDVRGMRAPFLSVGGNKMFKMLYDSNFTYDSSMPVYENRPPSWPYTLDYKLFHDCMIPPCPTKSYPGVWEVPMVMWQDLNGGRCSMGDACANPPNAEGVYKMLLKNFDRHYTTNRAPFGLFYHAAWFTQPHHKEGFIMFLDFINRMNDVWIVTNWQALQWVRDPTPINRLNNFQPFQCDYPDRPKKCNNPKVCNLWHKSGVRYMRTCQPCPEIYPWTGKSGIRSSRIDNDIEE